MNKNWFKNYDVEIVAGVIAVAATAFLVWWASSGG